MNRTFPLPALVATAAVVLLAFAVLAAGQPLRTAAKPALLTASPADAAVASSASAGAQSAPHAAMASATDIDAVTRAGTAALESRIDAKARAFEARMQRSAGSASIGDTVASAMAFAAEISTEVALVSALSAIETGSRSAPSKAEAEAAADAALDQRRRHARRIRGAMAVPYFSFAQGLRGAGS